MEPNGNSPRFDTRSVHAGREDLTDLGVHAPPLDLSTTYPISDLDSGRDQLDAFAAGQMPNGSPLYSRLHNPTVGRFERAIADLEGAETAVSFASGMGAMTAILLALPKDKRHIVAVRPLYGGSDHLLASDLLGIKTTFVNADQVASAIQKDTALIIIETPQNPTTTLLDIAQIAKTSKNIPVLVDNTFATPVLQRPLEHGASIVIHSATKYLGGHGDAMGGVVCCDENFATSLRSVRVATGAVMHPMAAYLLHRGLMTLPVRVRAMQKTATELARRLAQHPAVKAVHHPSLPSTDKNQLVGRQMSGPGAMLSFELSGGYEAARKLLSSVQLMLHAVSLGSSDTLIQHPVSLTHRIVDPEARVQNGISDGLIRISVGLEDIEDLWLDLQHALKQVEKDSYKATNSLLITDTESV